MKWWILINAIVAALLLYLLSRASANTALFSHNYYQLLLLAGVLVLGLAALVGAQLWQLYRKLRGRVYGARLTLRLALVFSVIAIVPGVLVYGVSVQFLNKGIESWFDVRVEKALESALNLGRGSLREELSELRSVGQQMAPVLTERKSRQHILDQFVTQGRAQEAALFDSAGRVLAFAAKTGNLPQLVPSIEVMRQIREKGGYSEIETLPDGHLVLRGVVPVSLPDAGLSVLQLVQRVPEQVAVDAETVQRVYRDYQQLALSRVDLKRLYGIALTLSLLIVLLSVGAAAFYFSERLSAPLATLAEGTAAVARGDFSGNYPVQSRDELGALTELFNQMTAYLAEAKRRGEAQQREVEQAKAYLESVLAHLSSGVLVVDGDHRLLTFNPGASQILGVPLHEWEGRTLEELADGHALVRSFVAAVLAGFGAAQSEWQQQLERLSREGEQILLLRGTRLATKGKGSHVVVFDDITHLLRTERQAAWGEVARRLAHEIKNPLTPIQLSAERLQHKLLDKLDGQDAQLLRRATQTIVSQVAAMKSMVMEFADYARAPATRLIPLDMHLLLNEVMGLYEANSSPVELRLNAVHHWVNGDATRLRQVIHNLLHNAHDALQQTPQPQIVLETRNTPEGTFLMRVCDNGCGIPENLMGRVFEPYVTTKQKGTGLGLAIVKKIMEEHRGQVSLERRSEGGTCVNVVLPLADKQAEVKQ